jgi:hypothetical protein
MNNWWNTLGAGSIVGSFQIVERLGEGGNAVVFRARSEQQPEVALKILKRLGPTGPAYQRFKDEISTMRALSNDPGILPILDSSLPLSATPNDPAWLAMPVATVISSAIKASATLDDVVRPMSELADTLARLHQRGIHHRDLKVDQGTRLDPSERRSMAHISEELSAWLKPPGLVPDPADIRGALAFVSASAAPGQQWADERSERIQMAHEFIEAILTKLTPLAEELRCAPGISVSVGIHGKPGSRVAGQGYVELNFLHRSDGRGVDHDESAWVESRGPHGTSLICGVLCELRGRELAVSAQHNLLVSGQNRPLWSSNKNLPLGSAIALNEMDDLVASLRGALPDALQRFGEELCKAAALAGAAVADLQRPSRHCRRCSTGLEH